MASIHKTKSSPFWYCSFTGPDGRRKFKSTQTEDKRQAAEVCRFMVRVTGYVRNKKLTPQKVRQLVDQLVEDIADMAGTPVKKMPVTQWCQDWLKNCQPTVASGSFHRYEAIIGHWLRFLGQRADGDIAAIEMPVVVEYRDWLVREGFSVSTVNNSIGLLRQVFGGAKTQRHLDQNPFDGVDNLRQAGKGKRRDFSVEEVTWLMKSAGDDAEWRGLILAGFYTGQRLGDIVGLEWSQIDLKKSFIEFRPAKLSRQNKVIHVPIHPVLSQYLVAVRASVPEEQTKVFPRSAGLKLQSVSTQFQVLMVRAGLAEVPKAGNGGNGLGRTVNELTFHSLRHSLSTALRAQGTNEAMAKAILGHESDRVAAGYTHLKADDLRPAIDLLPDVTAS